MVWNPFSSSSTAAPNASNTSEDGKVKVSHPLFVSGRDRNNHREVSLKYFKREKNNATHKWNRAERKRLENFITVIESGITEKDLRDYVEEQANELAKSEGLTEVPDAFLEQMVDQEFAKEAKAIRGGVKEETENNDDGSPPPPLEAHPTEEKQQTEEKQPVALAANQIEDPNAPLPTFHVKPTTADLKKHYDAMSANELQDHISNKDVEEEMISYVKQILVTKLKKEAKEAEDQKAQQLLNEENSVDNPLITHEGMSIKEAMGRRTSKRKIKQLDEIFEAPYSSESDNWIQQQLDGQWNFQAQNTPSYDFLVAKAKRANKVDGKKKAILGAKQYKQLENQFTRTDVFAPKPKLKALYWDETVQKNPVSQKPRRIAEIKAATNVEDEFAAFFRK